MQQQNGAQLTQKERQSRK